MVMVVEDYLISHWREQEKTKREVKWLVGSVVEDEIKDKGPEQGGKEAWFVMEETKSERETVKGKQYKI